MRSRIGILVLWFVLPIVVLAGFAGLLRSPGSLVVDSNHPSIDYARKNPERAPGNDLTDVFLPRFAYIRHHLESTGRVPLWDSSGFGGRPLVGNPQAGIFYPPVWLAYLDGRLASLGWLTVAHLIWAGAGVYLLGRWLGLSALASIVAGVGYELSPYLLGHAFEGHYPHVWSACWYPWAFLALIPASRGSRLGIFFCPLILALCFLCGHPQEWYYLVLALSFWWLIGQTLAFSSLGLKGWLSRMLLWGIILGVSLAIVAIDLLPQREAQAWSLRTGEIPLRFIARYQVRPENLLQLLSPFALGRPHDYFGHDNYWECLFSAGLCPLILATIGLFRYPGRGLVRAWGSLVLFATIFAAGRRLGLFSIAYLILPGMDRFRVPSRSLFLTALGVSILTGSGVDVLRKEFVEGLESRSLRRGVLLCLACVTILVLGLSRLSLPEVPIGRVSDARGVVLTKVPGPPKDETPAAFRLIQGTRKIASDPAFLGTLGAVALILIVPLRKDDRPVVTAYAFSAIAVIELVFQAQSLLVVSPGDRFVNSRVSQVLTRESAKSQAPYRVAAVESRYEDLAAVHSGIEKTNINDGFQIQHAADLYERLYPYLDPEPLAIAEDRPMDGPARAYHNVVARRVLNVMSVSAFISDRRMPWKGFVREATVEEYGRSITIWKNPQALPRAYIDPGVATVEDRGSLPLTAFLPIDDRKSVLMTDVPLKRSPTQSLPAKFVRDEGDRIELEVKTISSVYLVVANTWMPGWSAEVDARPVSVLRGNHCQQVIPIASAGNHRVILSYSPPGFQFGAVITTATLIGWLMGGLFWRRRVKLSAVVGVSFKSRGRSSC